jgi:ribosomal protein S18 acetylase RimI-like enzyme
MSLFFHPAQPEDYPLIRKLAGQIWRTCYPGMISPRQIEYMLAWMYNAEKIIEELAAGVVWEIVLLDRQPIGYLSLTVHSATDAELNKLYLLPEYQGRGHGQAMLARAEEIARQRGCTELRLRVNKSNERALRSYARAGFQIVDSLVADIGEGFVMDDHVLAKTLHL